MKKKSTQAKQQILEAISLAKQERESLIKKKEPLDRKLVKNYKLIEKLNDELSKLELTETKSLSEQFEYFLFEDGRVSSVRI